MGYRKIAVLRANAIGDFVFVLPALEALRSRFPKAEISLLGREWHRSFLEKRAAPVDRVIPVPASVGVNQDDLGEDGENLEELEAFFAEMEREEFDVALQLHGGGRHSNPFVRRLQPRLSAGLRAPDAEPLDRWTPYVYLQPEVFRYLEAVRLVGAQAVCFEPRLEASDQDLEESYQVVPEDGPLVLLNPNAGDSLRRWPLEKFAETAQALESSGARILVSGAKSDRQYCRELLETIGGSFTQDVSGALSLGGLLGLLSRCRLVVSNDSGPLHLAAAVGTPTVGIYWYPNMITAAPSGRANHRPAVSWLSHCPHCGLSLIHARCDQLESLVSEVSVAEVVGHARDLFHLKE